MHRLGAYDLQVAADKDDSEEWYDVRAFRARSIATSRLGLLSAKRSRYPRRPVVAEQFPLAYILHLMRPMAEGPSSSQEGTSRISPTSWHSRQRCWLRKEPR